MLSTDQAVKRVSNRRKEILFFISCVLLAAIFVPVIIDLVKQWLEDPNYRHGLLIPIVIFFMIKRKHSKLRAVQSTGDSAAGAIVLAVASVALIAGTAASELFTSRISLVIFLIGSAVFLAGARFASRLAEEFVLMLLMIPLPYIFYYRLTFPLQLLSARLSGGLLKSLQVNVIRKGNIIVLPNYTLEVVAACSGLRALMTMVTLSVVIAAFSGYSISRKIILVACSVPVAVAANTFRLSITALGAYLVGSGFADGILHQVSGLIVFLTGLLLLMAINSILKWKS